MPPQDPMLRDIVRNDSGKWVQTERAATEEELGTVRRAYALELDKFLMDINVGVTRIAETRYRKEKAGNTPYDFRGWWTDREGVISNDAFRKHFRTEIPGYEGAPVRLVEAIRQLEAHVDDLPKGGAPPSTLASVGSGLGVQLGIALAAGLVLLMAEGAL